MNSQDFFKNFASAHVGSPVHWVGWLFLFLVLYLAVQWDKRIRRKDEEKAEEKLMGFSWEEKDKPDREG